MNEASSAADGRSLELAGLVARLTAKLLDLTLTAAIGFAALMSFGFLTIDLGGIAGGYWEPRQFSDGAAYTRASPFLGVALFEAAMIATTTGRGKTLGKRLLRIKVVARGGSRTPSLLRATIRWLVPLVATAPLVDAFIRDVPELANADPTPTLSGRQWWLWVSLGWWLLVHASVFWDDDRRGWHDKAAGTIIVKTPGPCRSAQGPEIPHKWHGWRDVPFS